MVMIMLGVTTGSGETDWKTRHEYSNATRVARYYGACDHSICLATGSLSETVEACLLGL